MIPNIVRSANIAPIPPTIAARSMLAGFMIKNAPIANGVVNPNEKRNPAKNTPR